MGSVIGDVLPLAVGVAISPIPVVAAVLMLLSPRAKTTGMGFALGWILGVALIVGAFALAASLLPQERDDHSQPVVGSIKIVLGAVLLVLAVRQWRSRPADGTEPSMPAWMEAIDSMTTGRAFLLGLGLSALNPKNLLMGISAGVVIGAGGLSLGLSVVVAAVYVLIAVSTVAVPVISYLVATDRVAGPLSALRRWLVSNNAAVMTVLLLVIGVVVVGKGLGDF